MPHARSLLLPLQAAPRLPGHPGPGHLRPQPAVARREDGRSHPHGGRVLPLGTCQQRRPVGQASRARASPAQEGRGCALEAHSPESPVLTAAAGGPRQTEGGTVGLAGEQRSRGRVWASLSHLVVFSGERYIYGNRLPHRSLTGVLLVFTSHQRGLRTQWEQGARCCLSGCHSS